MTCLQCGAALDSRSTFCSGCGATVPDRHLGAVVAGRYRADKRIAIGNFGSIYRAIELISGRPVALKIMHAELAADHALVERFRREGVVLRKLLDRHAVATYELGETEHGLPFIAMELLEGETLLAAFRAHGPLPWPRALAIMKGACSALGEAHGLGIVHRDLKPANIFLTANDFVKVLDFGIARIMSSSQVGDPKELTVMGTAIGTLEYMAPEQLMGGKADPRTDIYTLGVVGYELICGRRPFDAAGLELLTVQLAEEVPPPSQRATVPPQVDRVLLRCLAPDADDRFSDVRELVRAIDDALAASPSPPAALPPPLAPAPPSARAASSPDRPVLAPTPAAHHASAPTPAAGPASAPERARGIDGRPGPAVSPARIAAAIVVVAAAITGVGIALANLL